jgi:hypothetical protein
MCEWQNDGTYDRGVIGAKVMDRWLSDVMTSFMSCRQVLAGGKADPSRHIEHTKTILGLDGMDCVRVAVVNVVCLYGCVF